MPYAVKKHNNEPFESMMKRFKKAVENDNTMKEVRKREYYEKPCDKRKRRKAAAKKRWERRKAELEPDYVPAKKGG